MNTKEQDSNQKLETPNSKLQKSSVIFMQLGLIIALLAVYFTLEHKSFIKRYAYVDLTTIDNIDTEVTPPIVIIKEPKVKVVKKIKVENPIVVKPIEKLNLIDDKKQIKETIEDKLLSIDDVKGTPVVSEPIDLEGIPDEPEEIKTPLPFYKIEDAPEFPGCKGSKEQKKVCFNKKMGKHVNKYFNIDLAQDLGLSPGKKRINVQFIIDEFGNITAIKSNAAHIRLKKEAERIVKKLPKMIPGKQRNKAVKVKFNLPINFIVED